MNDVDTNGRTKFQSIGNENELVEKKKQNAFEKCAGIATDEKVIKFDCIVRHTVAPRIFDKKIWFFSNAQLKKKTIQTKQFPKDNLNYL